jgi:hypothetical protein
MSFSVTRLVSDQHVQMNQRGVERITPDVLDCHRELLARQGPKGSHPELPEGVLGGGRDPVIRGSKQGRQVPRVHHRSAVTQAHSGGYDDIRHRRVEQSSEPSRRPILAQDSQKGRKVTTFDEWPDGREEYRFHSTIQLAQLPNSLYAVTRRPAKWNATGTDVPAARVKGRASSPLAKHILRRYSLVRQP